MKIGKVVIQWSIISVGYMYDPLTHKFSGVEMLTYFAWYEEQEANFISKGRYETYKVNILDFMFGLTSQTII